MDASLDSGLKVNLLSFSEMTKLEEEDKDNNAQLSYENKT